MSPATRAWRAVRVTVARVDTAAAIVTAYLSALASGDPEAVADCVTDDFVNEHLSELGEGSVGRDEYRRRLPAFLSTFADARYTIDALAEITPPDTNEPGVVVRYRFEATYDGTLIDIPGMMWFAIRDGRIARRTDLWDSLTFLRQTGSAV